MLSQTTTAQIVSEIHKIIDYDINIMDENAFISASTNPNRVGTFHAGAKKVIMQQLNELAVYNECLPRGHRKREHR
ncbi:MAG: sugar diacid recognition domain-containing protein [Oscillospiraceae bacterium]